jgi:hypothetical protein
MQGLGLGQIVRAEILEIVNNKPLEENQPSRYRLKVRIMDGKLAGKITYAAYKAVPKFSDNYILIRLDWPYPGTLKSTPEISEDSLVEHQGMRLAGHFLTTCFSTDSCDVNSNEVLLIAKFNDWMKATYAVPNEIEFHSNIPEVYFKEKTCVGLMSLEKFFQRTQLYKDIENPYPNPDFYQSLSLKFEDNDLLIRYDVPNLGKLFKGYDPGNMKGALYYCSQLGKVTAWEVNWNDSPTISRKLRKDGKKILRSLKTALLHYIRRMSTYETNNPPIMVVFDEHINFHKDLEPLIAIAERELSLKPSIMLQCQNPYNPLIIKK